MAVKIEKVAKKTLCRRKGLRDGDVLVSINGNPINDVLDYRFYAAEEVLHLTFTNCRNKTKERKIKYNGDVDSLGLQFETYLMDRQHACKNKCIFCFVDQMPGGMRDSLYFKDDDARLSFFFGNYITLTGLSEAEVQRIIKMHISPINVSVHTMNPELRVKMMKNPNAGSSLALLQRFADAGIRLNTQLVLCPGINDGAELTYSLEQLGKLYPAVQSIAAVPVGLTKHRNNLYPLHGYERESAQDVIRRIDDFNAHFKHQNGETIAFAADEFFILAEKPIPDTDYYGDFSQLDNGVGMLALLKDDFLQAMENAPAVATVDRDISLATGAAAYPYITELCDMFMKKYPSAHIRVHKIINHLFGESVTVAGLICGRDLIEGVRGKCAPDEFLLFSDVMLRSAEEPVFLDDLTVEDVARETGAQVMVVQDGGTQLFDALFSLIGG